MTGARADMDLDQPYIVALGGTLKPESSTEKALGVALAFARAFGARTLLIRGRDLEMPLYGAKQVERCLNARRLVAEIAQADGLLIASPAYHGGVSGLVKNALDHVEDLRTDPRPYFTGRAVGCIATGAGAQGAVAALSNIRSIVHALRGWPTPLGAAINTMEASFDPQGHCVDEKVRFALETVARDVVDFALARRALLARFVLIQGQARQDP